MKTITERGITMRLRHDSTTGYEQHARETIRGLFKPMGTDIERNERAAAEIARRIYAEKFGELPPAAAVPQCRWVKNRRGHKVIQSVTFVGAMASWDSIEIPGWDGPPPIAEDPHAQRSMF